MKIRSFIVLIFSLGLSACIGQISQCKQQSFALPDTVTRIGWEIRDIIQDSQGNMWFASNGDGVYLYDGKNLLQLTEKQGLSSNNVWKLKEAMDGKVWCYTNIQIGKKEEIILCYFDGSRFVQNEISHGAENPTDKQYNKHDDVLIDYYIQGHTATKFILPKTSPITEAMGLEPRFGYDVYASAKDQLGNAWFGTNSAGICMYDGTKYTWLNFPELSVPIRDLYFDRKGMLWILTNGCGVMKYDGNTLVNFTKQHNLTNPNNSAEGFLMRPWSITEDQACNQWIATIDAGVWKYDGKTATNYSLPEGLGIDYIWRVFRDQSNKIWVGTEGFGVYKFDGSKFQMFYFGE